MLLGEQVLLEEPCLQGLFEGREGYSCSNRAGEIIPLVGNKI